MIYFFLLKLILLFYNNIKNMKSIDYFFNYINLNVKYLIGLNKKENFDIIDLSNKNDIWFHLKDNPSCHVIAQISDLNIGKKKLKYIIKQGGVFCKQFSKFKSEKNVEIIYTNLKNIEKTDVLGTVLTSHTKTIKI